MSTFLELCQKVARDSGTISGVAPTTVENQVGRLSKIVNYTRDAWVDIQNQRNAWRWMRKDFASGDAITQGQRVYTAASFGITRFARWVVEDHMTWIYDKAKGQEDENWLMPIDWNAYRDKYVRGEHPENRPVEYTISPAEEFCLGGAPDMEYVVRGEFYLSPQILLVDGDIPEMPARFHDLIAHKALILMDEDDEAVFNVTRAMRRYDELLRGLVRDQLPTIHIGDRGPGEGPIA